MNSHDWNGFWVKEIDPITCNTKNFTQPCSINFMGRFPNYPLTAQLKISKEGQYGSQDETCQ